VLLCLGLFSVGCHHTPALVDGGSIQHRGADVYWSSEDFPLWVFVDDDMDVEHINSVIASCELWNHTLGVQVFEPVVWDFERTLPRTEGVVAVTISQLGVDGRATVNGLHRGSYYDGTSRKRASMIWFDEDLETASLDTVITHELGHALTLDHDNNPRSIMHPNVTQMVQPTFIMPEDVVRIQNMVRGTPSLTAAVGVRRLMLPGGMLL